MSYGEAIQQCIDSLIEEFGGGGKYVTVIIGVLVGDEKDVKTTEQEFDDATNDLLCANGFLKFSNFKKKEAEV